MNYNELLLATILGLMTQLNINANFNQGRGTSLIKEEVFSMSIEGFKQLAEKYVDIKSELENRFALGEHYHSTNRINDLIITIDDLNERAMDIRPLLSREQLNEIAEKALDKVVENLLRAEANITAETLWRRVDRVKKSMVDEN